MLLNLDFKFYIDAQIKAFKFLSIIFIIHAFPLILFCLPMFHSQIITQIINLVGTKEKTDLIFSYSKKLYDLHQFNVGSLYPKDVKKMNQSLKRRYKNQQIQILLTNWNQGERRLFVWFIICFLEEKKIRIEDITQEDLKSLSDIFYGKDTIFLDFQLRNLPKVTKAKRTWSSEEDELLKNAIKSLKDDMDESKVFNNWNDVAKIIFFQTERRVFRTPKSCRQRWYNHLDQSKKRVEFSLEQDLILLNYILKESKSWSKIVKVMNYSRTEHRIKNRYYTLIRKYQRSMEKSETEELTQEQEREIVIKLKTVFQARKERETEQEKEEIEEIEQIEQEESREVVKSQGVKVEECAENDESYVDEQVQRPLGNPISSETQKIKTQTDHVSSQQLLKVKVLDEQQIQLKSLTTPAELRQSSNYHILPSVYQNHMPLSSPYWLEGYTPYAQYSYYMNMPPQKVDNPHVTPTPVIVNQFYCPIYFQKGMGYQNYQQ